MHGFKDEITKAKFRTGDLWAQYDAMKVSSKETYVTIYTPITSKFQFSKG